MVMTASGLSLGQPTTLGPPEADLSGRQIEIIQQLEDIFVEEGFRHLTIADMADRLRCSRRTLYEVAPTRTELILVILDRRLRRLGMAGRELLDRAESYIDWIEGFLRASREVGQGPRLTQDILREPAAARLAGEYLRYHIALLKAVLQDAMDEGELASLHVDVLVHIIGASAERFRAQEFQEESGLSFDDAVTELMQVLRDGIASRDGRAQA